ncbi:MAG: PQQ-binding-like beta-propeller repeat protein [Planctomycetales bacterium]|nr:PQQ-binding-like beta-propeller repeat protein [Planctomycetales bacterium]
MSVFLQRLSAVEWPGFRGPSGNGVVATQRLPTRWSATSNISWKIELPGQGWSSPIVVDGKIYVSSAIARESVPDETASDPTAFDLCLLVLNAADGQLLQTVKLFKEPKSAPAIHSKNSHASPTPLYDDGRIYVHFGHQGTACVSTDGRVIWQNDFLGYNPVHGNGGCPIVVGGLLIFSRDGADTSEIIALDKTTGAVAWRRPRDVIADKKFSFCTPLVLAEDARVQLILPGSNVVQSIDPSNGQEFWRVTYDGYSVIPKPIYDSGLVFICTGYNRPSLIAIDPTGAGDVTETHVRWQSNDGIPHTPSLIGLGGSVAMVSDKGIASCFEATTGKSLWKQRIGGNFSASPIRSGDLLYLLSEEGTCTVLDVGAEPKKLSSNVLGERSLASPAVIENDLLIRTANALYRITDGDESLKN